MFKYHFILLLYVGIIYFVEINSEETLTEDSVKNKESAEIAEKLDKIEPNEALPLVLFKRRQLLRKPKKLKSITFDNGKLIHGTEFSHDRNFEQIFFCPEAESKEKCLIPKIFGEQEPLRCASQPTPVIESLNQQCGENKAGNYYSFNYEICKREEYEATMIPFYTTCYDTIHQKTLFTVHTIDSSLLLEAKLLLREREVNYTMMKKNEFPLLCRGPNDMEVDEVQTSYYDTPKSGYKWQKLVPSEDMALASWRKTTFQETNTALQHEKLTSLWDTISEYVRTNAIQMFRKNIIRTIFHTGVFDVNSASKDNNQLSNIWVKLILTTYSLKGDKDPTHGVAILMNNFIGNETSQSTSSNSESEGIDGYCKQDVCTDALKNEFNIIKGRVRCCAVTKKILDLFNETYVKLQELHIPGVNVTEDQETLGDGLNMTYEEAEKALREIQSNEILPIILRSDPKDFKLYTSFGIRKIETKDRRIVNGSQFFDERSGQQIFFCPRENSDEKCVAPREFGRFKPLQCTNPAIPAVRIAGLEKNKCGIDNIGILHQVVYEICSKQPPYEYQSTAMKIYEFCYNPTEKKVLYTRHRASSASLLNTKILIRERNTEYPMLEDLQLALSNIEELKEAASKENENSTSSTDSRETPYKLQKLVPSEDMAFATWKRATFQYVNVAFQHEDLFSLWKNIENYIKESTFKEELIRNYSSFHSRNSFSSYHHSGNYIYTGVLNSPSNSIGDEIGANQKSEIWFKVVHTERPTYQQSGIVILMNNYLISKKKDSETSNAEEDTLRHFCQENLCSKEFQNKFEPMGGRVRCCHWTARISKLLGIPNINISSNDTNMLFIPGIIADTRERLQTRYATPA